MVDSDSQEGNDSVLSHTWLALRQKATLKVESLLFVEVRVHDPDSILMASVVMSGFPP